MIDLLVAGGGPAGLATAIYAARAGLRVVVAEPRPAPVDKACGEGLMPRAVRELERLGVTASGHPFRGIRYLDEHTCAQAEFRAGSGLGVRRTVLHARLHQRVVELGVPILSHRVGLIRQDERRVQAGDLTARYLAAADGLHSPIRRQLQLDHPGRPSRRYGLRRHYRLQPWTDYVEVHWSTHAEAYLTPVDTDLLGVALLTAERGSFEDHLAAFPSLRSRLATATEEDDVLGAGPLRQRVRRRVAGRVLLVGDAAGYVDALTGEGIPVAIDAARELVECVRQDRPERYEQRWRRVSRSYRMLTGSLLWARRRRSLAPSIVPAAARLPRVFAGAVDTLGS